MILQIPVEYHQQGLTYYCSDTVEFWSSEAYRAEYKKMDNSGSLKWSSSASLTGIGSIASNLAASSAYGEVNREAFTYEIICFGGIFDLPKYSSVLNRQLCTFISNKVCLLLFI